MAQKILIVDDEKQIHQTLGRILAPLGFNLVSAFDGKEGLQKALQEKPDLIILDINMPVMTGTEMMKELRTNKSTFAIPVLMLTGNGDPVDKVVGYELGVEDYVTKPFYIPQLISRVTSLLEGDQRQ